MFLKVTMKYRSTKDEEFEMLSELDFIDAQQT